MITVVIPMIMSRGRWEGGEEAVEGGGKEVEVGLFVQFTH
jgi:hypothetical protein